MKQRSQTDIKKSIMLNFISQIYAGVSIFVDAVFKYIVIELYFHYLIN